MSKGLKETGKSDSGKNPLGDEGSPKPVPPTTIYFVRSKNHRKTCFGKTARICGKTYRGKWGKADTLSGILQVQALKPSIRTKRKKKEKDRKVIVLHAKGK